jgi:hypothetical protein
MSRHRVTASLSKKQIDVSLKMLITRVIKIRLVKVQIVAEEPQRSNRSTLYYPAAFLALVKAA